MNQFDTPAEYAANLLRTHNGEALAAIQHVQETHGMGGQFWRDTVALLEGSHGPETVEPLRNSINPAWQALSEHGKAALSYCRAHASVSKYGDTKGLSVVFMCWRDLAADMGIDIDAPGSTGLMLDALAEVRSAGFTRFFDHGTTAYGQVSTILN